MLCARANVERVDKARRKHFAHNIDQCLVFIMFVLHFMIHQMSLVQN